MTLTGEGLEQALIAEPPVLDFGLVPTDFTVAGVVVLRNLSTEQREQLMIQVAKRYYHLDMTMSDLSTELGLTRWQASRLLTEAKEIGLVRIEIVPHTPRLPGLDKVVVHETADAWRDAVIDDGDFGKYADPLQRGKIIFGIFCASCHTQTEAAKIGPGFKNLWGKREEFEDGTSAVVGVGSG